VKVGSRAPVMNDALHAAAMAIREAMPCSIELPAGGGKTQYVAALATVAAERGERSLVLTHTNAGVDVLRRRLRSFGLAGSAVRVDTIASWSWNLIRHYPRLSGVEVAQEPEWRKSKDFYVGATCAVGSQAITAVVQASYDLVIVDEYQDCIVEQHDLVVALAQILPVCVFGDRLQSIFGFGGEVIVAWGTDVVPTWPALGVPTRPWRWEGHNEPLGQWLLDIRPHLVAGRAVDLGSAPLIWRSSKDAPQEVIKACYGLASARGSVVVIGQFEKDCAYVGRQNRR
jgi:AAA domain